MNRAALDVESLLRIVLLLVIVWLVLRVLGEVLHIFFGIFRFVPDLIAVAIVVVIVLWLYDRI